MSTKFTPILLGVAVIAIAALLVFTNKETLAVPSVDTTNGTAYTLAQVAIHKQKTDCWTTIDGGIYDLTQWISKHPGGAEAIISLCGIDGSDAFNGQHGGQRRPASELTGFKIGILK